MSIRIEVLSTPDCPNVPEALARVREVTGRLSPDATVEEPRVRDLAEATRLAFPGSPTVRVEGRDVEGDEVGPPAIACRRYDGGAGSPPVWLIEAAVLRALSPRHVLFLCVANSARSQMAEAVGRRLASPAVVVSSAGSEPSSVRPEALRALAEIGIDASGQRSKGVEEVAGGEGAPVDLVITLCAEEACPVWLRPSLRVHWALPDPAAVNASEAQRMDAFRAVRDELVKRLETLFGGAATAPARAPAGASQPAPPPPSSTPEGSTRRGRSSRPGSGRRG